MRIQLNSLEEIDYSPAGPGAPCDKSHGLGSGAGFSIISGLDSISYENKSNIRKKE